MRFSWGCFKLRCDDIFVHNLTKLGQWHPLKIWIPFRTYIVSCLLLTFVSTHPSFVTINCSFASVFSQKKRKDKTRQREAHKELHSEGDKNDGYDRNGELEYPILIILVGNDFCERWCWNWWACRCTIKMWSSLCKWRILYSPWRWSRTTCKVGASWTVNRSLCLSTRVYGSCMRKCRWAM